MSRWFVILLLGVVSACSKTTSPSVGSQTHFLTSCEASCPEPYDCTCGVCTQACTGDASCEALASGATCEAPRAECGEASTCDVECERDADCEALSARHTCSEGRCRAAQVEADGCAAMGGADCTPLALSLGYVPEGAVCEWALPDSAPNAEELCSAMIVLSEPSEGRNTIATSMVASADACAGSTGWYATGTATDRRVVLCPDACRNAGGIAASQAVLTLACATGGAQRPSSCELEDIRPLLSTRGSSRACGSLPIATSSDERSAAFDCVRIAVADGATFDLSWARQGTDSALRSGLVGVREQEELVVYSLSYDSITFSGTPGLGELAVQSAWTPCASFVANDTCTGDLDSCFTCDPLAEQACGCIPSSAADELPEVACASEGAGAADAGTPDAGGPVAVDRGPICDGSDDVRLGLTSAGGFVDPTYEFTNPYGHAFLFVDGRCRYYASDDLAVGMRTGTLSAQQVQQLATEIGWVELDAFAASPDFNECDDGGTTTIWAPGVSAACECFCDESPVMLAKEAAIGRIYPWIEMLVMMGSPLDGPILAIAHEDGPERGGEQPWPLDRPLTEVDDLVRLDGAFSSAARFDDPVESAALRVLRTDSAVGPIRVSDAGVAYYLYLLDELDADVRASIDGLVDGARF